MATEANIQEALCLKKGEREENSLTSESFEEKVTELPGNQVKQLETSSLVTTTVYTPLETSKPTDESGIFFQALSVTMVIADEPSNTPESCKAAKQSEPECKTIEIEEKTIESEVCGENVPEKSEPEVGLKLLDSVEQSKKEAFNVSEKNQGDSDGVASSQDAACEDIKVTPEEHAAIVADFKEQDLNEMPIEFAKEETDDKSVDAQQAAEQCEIGSKDTEEQKHEKIEQDEETEEIKPDIETEKREQDGLVQAITPDACISTQTSQVQTTEHEEKEQVVNVLEKDQDEDDVTRAQEVTFEGGLQEKDHHSEDNEHEVVKLKGGIEEDADVCVSTQTTDTKTTLVKESIKTEELDDEKAIEKEVGEENGPKKTELEEGLEISDSMAPSQKEILTTKDKDQGDNDGVTGLQESPCVDVEETTTVQHVTTAIDFKEQDLNEKPREFINKETEDKSLDAQEASGECKKGAKEEIDQNPEESVIKIEKEEETAEIKPGVEIEKTEHEEEDTQNNDGLKEKSDSPSIEEVSEETGPEKDEYEKEVKDSAIATATKDETEDEEKEQEANVLETDEGKVDVTSAQDVTFEKDLQEKNHHNEDDEREKDTEVIKSSEKMEQQTLINDLPSDVCISTQTEPIEETTENIAEESVERDHGQTNKSEEGLLLSDSSSKALNENETVRKDQEKEQEIYITEKVQSGGDEVTSSGNASNEQEQHTEEIKPSVETTEEKDVCIPTQIESQENATKNEDNTTENDGDRKEKSENPFVNEVCEVSDLKKTEPEEEIKLTDSSNVTTRESVDEATEETKSSDETKETMEQQEVSNDITADISSSTQTENIEKTTAIDENKDEETIEHDDGQTEKPESPLVEVKQSDSFSTTLNEDETLSKEENLEKEGENKTSEVQGGEDDVTSSKNASNEDIKETKTGHHDTNVAYVEEGQGVIAVPKEILTEQADDKSIHAEELGHSDEQNVEETQPCLSETISQNPEDEIKKEDKDLSDESVEDANDDSTKEEKCTLEQEHVEEHNDQDEVSKEKVTDLKETKEIEPKQEIIPSTSLETSTEDTSNSEKEKAESEILTKENLETVSEEKILEFVPKSEEPVLKETETHVDEEKGTVTKEISSAEKTEVQSDGDDVTSSQNASNGDIQETIGQHDTTVTFVEQGQGMSATPKEILIEEAEDKSVVAEEMPLELGQPNEQNVEEAHSCLGKITTENPEEEIKKEDKDLSHESVEDTNDDIVKEEKCTLKQEPVEEHSGQVEVSKEQVTDLSGTTEVEPQEEITPSTSLETSTEDTSISQKIKAESENLQIEDLETVSEVEIPELVPKSEEPTLKEKCFILETEPRLDEEKETVTEEISSDEKTQQTTEIKQETVKEVCEETSSEKAEFENVKLSDSSNMKINEKEIVFKDDDEEKDQDVNMSTESQGEDILTSSQIEVSEEKEDLKEKNNQGNEGDFNKSGQGVEEDTEDIKSSVDTKENTEHVTATDVCSSTQTETREETIENEEKNGEKAIEQEYEAVSREEDLERKQEDVEETKMGEHATTNEEKVVCVSTQSESQEEPTKNAENAIERDGDQKEKSENTVVKEVCEEKDLTTTEAEGRQLSDSSEIKTREGVDEDTEETKSSDEPKEKMEQQEEFNAITSDVCSSTQTEIIEKSTASEEKNDAETIENNDGQTEKPASPLVEVVCETTKSEIVESQEEVKQSDHSSTTLNENETLSKEEKLEKEDEIKTSEVEGGEVDVTSSHNSSNEDIKEITSDQQNTTAAPVEEGQGVNALPKEILIEEAEDKSIDAEELMEHGQPNEQNVEETHPCVSKIISEIPEDEIKKEDRDLSLEGAEDRNDNTAKEEKFTLEHEPIEEHIAQDEVSKEKVIELNVKTEVVEPQEDAPSVSSETLTEVTSNSEKEKEETENLPKEDLKTVSEVQIPEAVARSEESVLKEECFISEKDTRDEEKGTITEEISSAKKTEQTAEIKQETVMGECEETSSEKTEREEGLNEKEIITLKEDDQEVNTSAESQGEDNIASSQNEVSEEKEDLKEKNHHNEGDFIECGEGVDEDTREFKSSVETKDTEHVVTTNSSAQIEPDEETIEKDEKNDENEIVGREENVEKKQEDIKETNMGEHATTVAYFEEEQSLSEVIGEAKGDKSVFVQEKTEQHDEENVEKEQKAEEQNDEIKPSVETTAEKDVCISTQTESHVEPTKNEENVVEGDGDKKENPDNPLVKEVCEEDDLTKTESEERQLSESSAVKSREYVNEDTEETKSRDEIKENVEQQGVLNVITTDVSSSTQTQNVEKTTASEENNDEETIEHEEKPESTLVEVVCEETRSEIVESEEVVKQSETCSTALNENEAQSKEEKLEKEDDIKTSEVEGGEVEVTNSQNASNEDIIETMIDLHNTNVAHVDEGQAVSVLPKEILKEEAKDKSADAEETSLELGQPNEQNAEETLPCLTKSISDNPEDEIKKEDRDLSNESVKDTNDGSIKEEKYTIEQGPVEEHNDSDEVSKEKVTNLHETTEVEPQEDITPSISLETLTEDTSNPEEKKAEVETLATEDLETVSDVQIPELVPKSEESVLKKECFISEIETHLDGEKESVTEKISNDEKTAQTAEIKQETVKEVCEEITREEAEDKSIHDQEASEQCENEAKDKIEQQPEESVNKPVNSSYSETNEGSIKEEQEDTDNNTKIESELEAENQADKIEDRTEMKDEVVLTEKVSKELEQNKKQNVEETETKDEDLSHDSIELINENITTEEKCLPDVITRELEISTLEHESINNSQDEVSKEKITDLNEPTAVEPHEDITLSSSLETSTEDTLSSNKAKAVSENLPLEDLESVSKVHIPEVVAKSEDLKMKEECLVSTTETYADEENRIATKEISSDENLETHGSAQQPENSYSITEESVTQLEQTGETNSLYENRDIKEEVTQENQLNSTEDCNEMEKDVNLTKEVPSETEKGKGINDLKEKIVEEDTYSPELEEKSTQSQKEIGHEISNLDLMPAEKPMVTEVNVDAQIGQEDLQGKEDISCVSEVTNDATVESVDLSTIESTAYPSEIEKLATRSLESDRDVQIPEVVADSKDSKVKEECIVIATTAENSVEEQDTKTKEISSAPDKEQENVTKATTESDEAKSSDLIIEEKALTKENLEIHGELEPTSEPAIEDQVIIETKPQPEQSDITSENIINDQTSESKLEHTSRKDSEDVKGHTEEHVTLASENETKSIKNLNETTKDIILTDEQVVVETEKEKEKDETEGQVPEDVKCLTEIDGTSTLDQKELASEMEYSKPIPVGNIDLTEVKEESQREENIQATEDLSCLSKASSVIEASKMDMHEDTKQTITVIEGVNDDSIDEAKDKIVPVLEDSKASELQVNLPEIESTDTPTNSQESMKLREEVSCRTQETIEEKDALTSQLTDREILEEKDDKPISELRTFSEDQISINERCIEEEVQSNFDVEIKDAIIGNEAVEDVITNEVLLEDEKAKESKSNKDIINEEAKLTQLTSDTDVGQIEKADSKSDELLETKQLVEDTEDVKFTVENLSIKDETITVIKKSNEDSEVVASEFKRLEDTVTDKEKETLDEPQADDSEKTTSTEQHIEVRSEESRGQSDMLKLKENPTVVTEVAKIVPECRDASAILADTLPEPSPEVLLAKPEDKITENQEVLPSVEKDFIDVQKHEKDLDHETEVRIADVVSNVECSEIEPRYLKTKETTLEFINQENQREQKKEANASIKDVIPVEDVKISTREPEVGSADLEVPSITDTTADKANNKTLEVQEAGGLLKDDKQLESACDQSKSKEEGSGVKQEPSELDASGTLGTAATEELKISQKYVPDDLIIISQTHAEIPKHKVPACTVDKQSPNEPQPKESTESKIFTENIDSPGEPVAKSLTPEAADLEANTPVFVDQKEKSLSVEPAKIVSHEPATENSEVAGSLIGEKDSTLTKDQQVEKEETVKTDDEDEGEDNEEDETMGSCSDAPVMVEASKDMEVKAHKKSHNILSGVGSKVKHSIAKVKKAITGKSSSPTKSTSPKAKNQVTD